MSGRHAPPFGLSLPKRSAPAFACLRRGAHRLSRCSGILRPLRRQLPIIKSSPRGFGHAPCRSEVCRDLHRQPIGMTMPSAGHRSSPSLHRLWPATASRAPLQRVLSARNAPALLLTASERGHTRRRGTGIEIVFHGDANRSGHGGCCRHDPTGGRLQKRHFRRDDDHRWT